MLRYSMGGRKYKPRDHADLVIFRRAQNDTPCGRFRACSARVGGGASRSALRGAALAGWAARGLKECVRQPRQAVVRRS